VLLSAGVDFDTYVDQVRVACTAGASGILCGRAVWKESVQLPGPDRVAFLQIVGRSRFSQLAEMVAASARPFTDFYPPSAGEDLENWYH
jgi:tagatose 1,6-diphosphate aldolase